MAETGKLTTSQLKELVLGNLGVRREDVLLPPRMGEDSAVIDFGEWVCVISTDPITGASKDIGRLALHISCNDLAATGAVPLGIQLALLLPVGTEKSVIKDIMVDIDREAEAMGVQILGGHTEITSAVTQIVIVATAVGKAPRGGFIPSGGAQVGDSIILTKGAGLEGAGILAGDFRETLLKAGVSEQRLQEAEALLENISVVPEGLLAAQQGATAMHDVTEGGILGAVFELTAASEKGFLLWEEKIYIPPAVEEITSALGLNPLALISSGAMLITTPHPLRLLRALELAGIKGMVIGEIKEEGRKFMAKDGSTTMIDDAPRDELWRFFDRKQD